MKPATLRRQMQRNPKHNAIAIAVMRRDAMTIIARLRTDANIHALIGQDAATAIHASASIMYIALGAAIQAGSTGDEPDLRVIRGAASAAGDVAANPALLEANRQAIISGLEATDRIWPALHPRELIHQYIRLQQMLASPGGLNLLDFEPVDSMESAQSAIK